jgi:hypothetical protein
MTTGVVAWHPRLLICTPGPIGTLASATTTLPQPLWSVWPWDDADPIVRHYDERFTVMSDTAIAVSPARHSLRFNVPTDKPVIVALLGKQLVTDGPWHTNMRWKPSTPVQPGDHVVGTSVVLPGGRSFRVLLLVQASPCGTAIALMSGSWRVTTSQERDMEEDARGIYDGQELTSIVPCGATWTRLEMDLQLPPGNMTRNGTALQLQFTAPHNERQWGATVWIGYASIVSIQP